MGTPSKSKRLAIDTVLFGISTFGSKILVFLLTPLYTAALLTEEFGVADLINTTVNLIYPIITLAITDATLRYALDKNSAKSAVLGNSIAITVLSILLLTAFYPLICMMDSEIAVQLSKYWGYFVLTYSMYNFHLCFSNFVKGIGKTKLFAVQGIVQTITVIICNIYFLLIAGIGLQGYLLSIIIGLFVPTVLMFFAGGIYKHMIPLKLDKKLLGHMLKYSIPMIPTLLSWSINMNINKYMLIGLLPSGEGLSASGVFSVANKIPSLLSAVISIFIQAWQLSAIANVNDADESAYYTKTYRSMHIVSIAGCLLIIPFSKIISSIMFDSSYYLAWKHIPFLTISSFFSGLCGFLAAGFRAYKKTGQLVISVSAGAGINILLNLILIKTIGVIGASIATAASFFVTWIVRMHTIQKLVKVEIRLLPTVATYLLVLIGSIFITFEFPYEYAVFSVACGLILAINFKDIKDTFLSVIGIFRRKINVQTEEEI